MDIIDSQIHVWEDAPPPNRAWDGKTTSGGMGDALTIDRAIVAMDVMGVRGAVLNVLPMYRRPMDGFFRFDNSYAEEAATQYPDRFASVGRVDRDDPDLDNQLRELMARPGVVGIRAVAYNAEIAEAMREGAFERLFSAAEQQHVPIWVMVQPHLDLLPEIGRGHPDLPVVIDHMGLKQPPHDTPDSEPFAQWPDVLSLAAFPNFSIKLTAAPTLSREPYPFHDLWPHIHRLIEAFGPDRIMWGSDFTRVRGLVTYSESLDYIRYTDELSHSDKEMILGRTLQRVFKWEPGALAQAAAAGSQH